MNYRQFRIFLYTIVSIFVAAILLAISIGAATQLTERTIDWTDSDEFFGFFSNTIGLAIAAAASVIAIILAYNSQHSAEVQTTTVALQEFRSEIDAFVNLCNQYYDGTNSLVRTSLELRDTSREISNKLRIYEDENDGSSSVGLEEALQTFDGKLAKFRQDIDLLQRLITGAGNFFFRRMMEQNFLLYKGYTNGLIDALDAHPRDSSRFVLPTPHAEVTLASPGKAKPEIKRQLGKFAMCYPLIAVKRFDSDEYNARDGMIHFLSSELSVGEILYKNDTLKALETLALYLPCLPSNVDFNLEAALEGNPDEPVTVRTELDEWLEDVREIIRTPDELSEKAANSLPAYKFILPFYLAMANPASGIAEMRAFFKKFGADDVSLRLFIDIHSARLKYNYSAETDILFTPCVEAAPKS